jgi:hypothetical protein
MGLISQSRKAANSGINSTNGNNCDTFKEQIREKNNKISRYQIKIERLKALMEPNILTINTLQNQIGQDTILQTSLNDQILGLNDQINLAKEEIIRFKQQMEANEIECSKEKHDLQGIINDSDISNNVKILHNIKRDANIADEYLSSHYQKISNDITKEKIEYREVEHQKLVTLNKTLDILFYCIFSAFVIIIIVTGNFKFKEHFLLYLFMILIPFLFPYLYKLCKHFYGLNSSSYGPKNAFIDKSNDPFLSAYNI